MSEWVTRKVQVDDAMVSWPKWLVYNSYQMAGPISVALAPGGSTYSVPVNQSAN